MKWLYSVCCMALFASVLGAQQVLPQPQPVPPQISTSATGEAKVQPDRATIQFAVETRAATAAKAGADNARRQQAVIDAIKKLGLADGQVSTSGYSVAPEMRYDGKQPQVVGYVARNVIQANVRRIDQVGALIDAALGAGANVVSSLRFYSSKADEGRRVALADAVAKARSDAECDGAGRRWYPWRAGGAVYRWVTSPDVRGGRVCAHCCERRRDSDANRPRGTDHHRVRVRTVELRSRAVGLVGQRRSYR